MLPPELLDGLSLGLMPPDEVVMRPTLIDL